MRIPHKTPRWIQQLYPSLEWRVGTAKNAVFVTFDDGPVPELTPAILDILADYEARATFFCVGENVERYPEIFQRLLDEGHAVGNHTHRHLNGWKTPATTYLEDIGACQTAIEARGAQTDLLRPPYGRISRKQLRQLHTRYRIVMWDVLSGDFDPRLSATECLDKTLEFVREGSIVVFHDNIKATERVLGALPGFMDEMSKREWKCLPLT